MRRILFALLTMLSGLSAFAQYTTFGTGNPETDGVISFYFGLGSAGSTPMDIGYPTDVATGYRPNGITYQFGAEIRTGQTRGLTLHLAAGFTVSEGGLDRTGMMKEALETEFPDMDILKTEFRTQREDEAAVTHQSRTTNYMFGGGYAFREGPFTIGASLSLMFHNPNAMETTSFLKEKNSNRYYELRYRFDDDEFHSAVGPALGFRISSEVSDHLEFFASGYYGWGWYNFTYYEYFYDIYDQIEYYQEIRHRGMVNPYFATVGIGYKF